MSIRPILIKAKTPTLKAIKCLLPYGIVAILRSMRIFFRRKCGDLDRSKQIKGYFKTHGIHKLHLGCGKYILKGWLNTDLDRSNEIGYIDVRERLPFQDTLFDYIYFEHLIEHVDYREGMQLLAECYRILKPGGKIRIATPDIHFLMKLSSPNKTDLQKRYIAWALKGLSLCSAIYGDIIIINNFFKDWGHKFIYSYEAITGTMNGAGFTNVKRYDVGESDDENFRSIESHGMTIGEEFNRLETFAVEGVRPAL